MESVVNKLILELNKVIDGDPWYGASLKSILEDVNAQKAVKRVSYNTHSIAEIALHILAWIEEVASRLEENPPKNPARGDWQKVENLDKHEWDIIRQKIFEEHIRVIELTSSLHLEKLDQQVGDERSPALGTGISFREMLLGLMEHNIYHGGQIALLKKIIKE